MTLFVNTADFVNVYDLTKPGAMSETLPRIILLLVSGGAAITFGSRIKKRREEL